MIINKPRTPVERLLWAYQYGHAWNTSRPNLLNLDEGRIKLMNGTEKDAKELIASWQSLDANVNKAVQLFLGRDLIPDGDVGPASEFMMDAKRCAIPDYAPPPNASFHYPHPGVQAAVESYQRWAAATGSGSWPVGCDPTRKDAHSVVVGISTANASTFQKSIMADVLRYVEETEAEIGQAVRHVLDGSFANPQHSVKFEFIAGGVIGYAYFPEPDTCNQVVTARIDNSFDARLPVLAELLTHEYKGHSDGCPHTKGGIMNPSIGSPTVRATWKGDPSYSRKKKWFGGEPLVIAPPPGPGPIPPPGPGEVYWIKVEANALVMMKSPVSGPDVRLGEYIIVKK